MAPSYPDLSIKDDWNSRQSAPVTSFADDVARAERDPQPGLFHDPATGEFVETSAGAVPVDSEQAKAAADVRVKDVDPWAADRETETEDDDENDDDEVSDTGAFDPSEHTVEEVNAYLADADDAERERVLAAERAGKNRSSI